MCDDDCVTFALAASFTSSSMKAYSRFLNQLSLIRSSIHRNLACVSSSVPTPVSMKKVDHTYEAAASNTAISTSTKLEEAVVSASQYVAADIWSAVEQASLALVDPETMSDADVGISIKSTAQLMQSADQLYKRASNYLERLRTLKVTLMTKLREEEKADDEKESDDSDKSKNGGMRGEKGGG